MRPLLFAILLCLCAIAGAADHGVILLYHHISEDTPPSTSVTPAQFLRHLDYLHDNNYQVMALDTLLDKIYNGEPVPDNTVAITFDDAYESVYSEAFPELRKRGWPFTVFVADAGVDQGYANSMNWAQMREMAADGVAFGGHSVTHGHLTRQRGGESSEQWRDRVENEIDANVRRLTKQLNVAIRVFAYPYGEYNESLQSLLTDRDLYGLAQQSGAVGALTPSRQIPRFPMATGFASMDRFRTAVNSRPLPVSKTSAGATVIEANSGPSAITLTLQPGPYRTEALRCFSASGEKLSVAHHSGTIRVQLPVFHRGRNKVNCTAPSTGRAGEFFWYSHFWLFQDATGNSGGTHIQ